MSKKPVEVDEHMVENLILYADNESALYNQKKSIENNLSKKVCDGKFDLALSAKLWKHWYDNAAKHHDRAFGGHIGVPERMAAAQQMAKHFASNWSYDEVIPATSDGEAWRLVRQTYGSPWTATLPDRLGGAPIVHTYDAKTSQRVVLKHLKQLSRKILKAWTHSEKLEDALRETLQKIDKKSSSALRKRALKLWRQMPKGMKAQYESQVMMRSDAPAKVARVQRGGDSKVWKAAQAGATGLQKELKGAVGGNDHLHLTKGARVELRPHLDRWMMGDRFGDVVSAAKGVVKVKLDKSGKTLKFRPADLTLLNEQGRAMFTTDELYERLVDAGAQLDHHESDLYVKVDTTSTQILDRYVHKNQVKSFVSPTDHARWYDVPFAYNPYWTKKG